MVAQAVSPPPGELDPDVIDADFRELVRAAEEALIPPPPYWYKEERSAPDLGEITSLAHAERSDHALRVLQSAMFESRVGLEFSSVFDRDIDWVKVGEIEQWVSPILRNEHDALVAFIESQVLMPKARRRSLVDAEESATKEDYFLDIIDDWAASHMRSGNGTLLSSLAYDAAVHAMWAIYLGPDPGNERTGLRYRRVDPKIVYPVFEGDRGLGQVFCVYDAEVKDMLAWHGDGDGKVSRQIKAMGSVRQGSAYDMHACHEVIEWYGRTWAVVIYGGKVIKKWRHRFWRPPWLVIPFCWRRQTSSVSLGNGIGGGLWGEPLAPNDEGILTIASNRQKDLARVYEPFLAPRLPLHDATEKIVSRLLTAVRRAQNSPLVWTQPIQQSKQPAPEIQNWEGGLTIIPEGNTGGQALDTLPTVPVNEAMEPMLQFLTTAYQSSIPLPLLQGGALGAQASGSAIDVLMQTGIDKWVPVVKGINGGFTEFAHQCLLWVRDFGATMGPEVAGYLDVPRRNPDSYGLANSRRLTPEMLKRTDCYLDVTLARFHVAGMLAAANTIATIRNTGVMSKREAIELLAYTNNPERSLVMRREEELEETPGVLEAMTIEHLYEQLYAAYVAEDWESVRRIMIRGRRVAQMQQLADQQLAMMGAAAAPSPPAAAGGEAAMGAGVPSLPTDALGNAVGVEGGRYALGTGGV